MKLAKIRWKRYFSKIKKFPHDEAGEKAAQRLYWKCIIMKYRISRLDLSEMKWKQFKWMCDNPQFALLYCRGGGKTLLGAHFVAYRTIRYGESIWAADSRGQLTELFKHFKSCPFIKPFKSAINRQSVNILDNTVIHTIPLTESAFLGKHTLTLMLDEVARMDTTLIGLIRKCLMKGGIEGFLSTPVLGSFFQTLTTVYPTLKITYKECGDWIDIDKIDREMELFPTLIEIYKREYMCIFTALEGAVFKNIEYISQSEMNRISGLCEFKRQGMDFNTDPGHVGVQLGEYDNKVYCLQTRVFPYGIHNNALKNWLKEYPSEVEDGGANKAFQQEIGPISANNITHQSVPAMFWFMRIGLALMNPIVVVENSPLANDLSSLTFKNGKVAMNPLHYCAAFLHAIGATQKYFHNDAEAPIVLRERERDREARRGDPHRTISVSSSIF